MVKVVATAVGFYDRYRYPGDEFEIKADVKADEEKGIKAHRHFSEKWMEKVGKSSAPAKEPVAVVYQDRFKDLDMEALIAFGKANCPELKLTRNMSEDTMRVRLSERLPE